MNAVRPDVDVVAVGQVPLFPRSELGLPLGGQPRDRRGRQALGLLAQQRLEGRHEVVGRQPAQVQHGQHLRHLRRPPHVRRQDLARELLALAIDDALVVDPWRLDLDLAGTRRDSSRLRLAVADDLAVALVVALVLVPADVLLDLGLERCGQHPPRAAQDHRIQVLPQAALVFYLVLDYLQHWWRFLPSQLQLGVLVFGSRGRLRRRFDAADEISGPQLLVIPPEFGVLPARRPAQASSGSTAKSQGSSGCPNSIAKIAAVLR